MAFLHLLLFCIICIVAYVSSSPCINVKPSSTDPLINAWDEVHAVCPPDTATLRNELFIWFPGTNGHPSFSAILLWAQSLGFHAIGLNYPNNGSVASKCVNSNDTDLNCHWKLRNETVFGINYSPHVNISHSNSIVNRIHKLLIYMSKNYPAQGWEQFIGQKTINKIVTAGSSQGSGYALFMGKYFSLTRVVMFSGTEDFVKDTSSPLGFKSASWVAAPSATPIDRVFGFNSVNDTFCMLSENNFITAQLPGNWSSIDTSQFPYSESHRLCTAQCPKHGCVTRDDYADLFKPVWTYLLTYKKSQRRKNVNALSLLAGGFPSGPCKCSGPPHSVPDAFQKGA